MSTIGETTFEICPFDVEISHRTIDGGLGYNLPREAPGAFAQASVGEAAAT